MPRSRRIIRTGATLAHEHLAPHEHGVARVVKGALILGYHRLSADPAGDPIGRDLRVTPSRFRRQIELVAQRFSIVPLSDLIARRRHGLPIDGLAAVTFDDGHADNYSEALPILSHMGVPATVFLATDYVDRPRPFWTDRLAAFVGDHAGTVLALPAELGGAVDLTSPDRLRSGYARLLRTLRSWSDPSRRERMLDELDAPRPADSLPLTWSQVREMHAHGVTFGAHSRTHPSLADVPHTVLMEELASSRDRVAACLNMQSIPFAYPFGAVEGHVWRTAKAAGFSGAVAVRAGLCSAASPLFLLPRLTVGDWDAAVFVQRLDGLAVDAPPFARFMRKLRMTVPRPAAAAVRAARPKRRTV
jgi:peptidoglycan/xylan/chitin deacetylase (PgdA/CDA1 family)